VERGEPLVAIGGGALGDAAGFLAASWLRGVPLIHVPTTLVAQIDSAIGGKTGVDLPEGKNLVGAFHPPAAIVIDIALLGSLPERQRRAALGEAVAHGLRGAVRVGVALDVTPPERAERIERLLTGLELATTPLPYELPAVLAALSSDKKHAGGALRWVLPTADGTVIRADVPAAVVEQAAASLLTAPARRTGVAS
jgi:3-dehydroquinate synthetase